MTCLRPLVVLGLVLLSLLAMPALLIHGGAGGQEEATPLGLGYTLALQFLAAGLPVSFCLALICL